MASGEEYCVHMASETHREAMRELLGRGASIKVTKSVTEYVDGKVTKTVTEFVDRGCQEGPSQATEHVMDSETGSIHNDALQSLIQRGSTFKVTSKTTVTDIGGSSQIPHSPVLLKMIEAEEKRRREGALPAQPTLTMEDLCANNGQARREGAEYNPEAAKIPQVATEPQEVARGPLPITHNVNIFHINSVRKSISFLVASLGHYMNLFRATSKYYSKYRNEQLLQLGLPTDGPEHETTVNDAIYGGYNLQCGETSLNMRLQGIDMAQGVYVVEQVCRAIAEAKSNGEGSITLDLDELLDISKVVSMVELLEDEYKVEEDGDEEPAQ